MHRDEGPVGAWEFDRDVDPVLALRCALDHIEPPDLRVVVTSTTGDTITIEIIDGVLTDPDSLLYVEQRGFFEVMRSERRFTSGRAREALALRAYPSTSTSVTGPQPARASPLRAFP